MKSYVEQTSDYSRLLLNDCSIVRTRENITMSTSYAPYKVLCPTTPLVREANHVSRIIFISCAPFLLTSSYLVLAKIIIFQEEV